MPILSSLIVSLDAFFIGLSLGLQKSCRFIYLCLMNLFLFILCFLGFFASEKIYNIIPIEPDLIVGLSFITIGIWYILHYLIFTHKKKANDHFNFSKKSFILVALVMSFEAMLITIGITVLFIEQATLLIPLTVALAHFGYSSFSFFFARRNYIRKIPELLTNIISGLSLITYGLLALFFEFTI